MLEVKDLKVKYGVIEAIKGVTFNVKEGSIVSLIGANGAGKTTILKTISGLLKPTNGTIVYLGRHLEKMKAHEIVKMGLSHVPEGRHIFHEAIVSDNLILGSYIRKDKDVNSDILKVYERFPRLLERKKQLAGTLSGGEMQMLAIARALMTRPKLLLLDEPSMGLAPLLVKEIFKVIKEINEQGVTIIIVEQNAKMALEISDYAYVLENGRISLEGSGPSLKDNELVKKAYLGG